jgi:hypothetical protein
MMKLVLRFLKNPEQWSLTLFVSLVLILQSAGPSLALCKLGIEESGCCGAHATAAVPSCCSGGAKAPESPKEGEGARESDCTCELFGALPNLSSESTTESAQRLLEVEHSINSLASCLRAGELTAELLSVRPLPPPMAPPPGSSTRRCAKLGSWQL